jgi:ATP-dependent helicase/nuclease subunit B
LPCDFVSLREKKHVRAHFLLGPAGSGKTFRCLAEIRAALAAAPEGPPLVLLAPKQATFQLERQLLASERWGERPREPSSTSPGSSSGVSPHQICGYTRLNIFSFERLARFVLDALGAPLPSGLLAEEGRVMVLWALLRRHGDDLELFRQSARRPGFARQLSQLLGELQQHQYTPAKLRAWSQHDGLSPELQHKLRDLALLLEAYVRWLAEHGLQDGHRLLDAATDALRKNPKTPDARLHIQKLWLDGFAEMTLQELDLLAACLPRTERATLAFCLASEPEAEASWLSIWSSIGKTFQRCRQRISQLPDCNITIESLERNPKTSRFAGNPALQQLEAGWATPRQNPGPNARPPASSVRVIACSSPEIEAAFAAREILKFAHAGGRFRDCAVLMRSLDGYHQPLARAFRRYDIPFFLDRRESAAHHPLAELTRNALRTVAFDWAPDDWFAALKAGFSPVEETEIDRLENESLARGWHGAFWREPLQIAENPGLAQSLERLRNKILPPFEHFARQLARAENCPTGKQLADALRGLWAELRVEETLERWNLDGADLPAPATRHPSLHQTVGEQMESWLDNVELAFSAEALPLREWLPILEAGLATLTVGVIPPALDQVLIGAIDRARNPDLKLALVLGLNESVFPAAPADPVILTDTDRNELGSRAAALGPDLRERLARERYLGYIACTRASDKLVLTFSRHDAGGKSLNPSPFIAQVRRNFPGLQVEVFGGAVEPDAAEHASELIAPIVEVGNLAGAGVMRPGDQKTLKSSPATVNWERVLESPALKNLSASLAALREPDAAEGLAPALAEQLFGPTLNSSVSRLEQFAACPFRFFVHSGLRAGERKVFELDAREQGSFQHEVLKMFHGQLRAEHKRWRDVTPADARDRAGKIAAALAADYRGGLLHADEQSRFTARMLAESLQDFVETLVGWMRGQYEFDPALAELEFGFGADGAPAWKIDLGQGRRLALRGRIDRIDLCPEHDGETWCAVMDYKSGGQKLDKVLVEHGVQLQLLAYLAAIRSWPSEVWAVLNLPAFFFRSSPGEPRTLGAMKIAPAGVFYVNLRGQYESGQTRDEALSGRDEARRRAYRHTGRFDVSALPKLDRAQAADQFNYRLNQDGSVRANSTEALPGAEFNALLERVETKLQEMGRAIFSGAAQVDPYRKGHETPCEFCDYRAVCRIDPWTHQYRVLRATPAEKDAADQ